MSLTKLEEKLYQINFSSKNKRLDAYLAVHATILNNKSIPRTFISKYIDSKDKIDFILSKLLFCDISKTIDNTNNILHEIGISTKSIQSLSLDDKNELFMIVEDIISNGWGPGNVHYERLRLSPDSDCHLLTILKSVHNFSEIINPLIQILSQRQDSSLKFQKELHSIFPIGSMKYHQSVLSRSYQMLLEKQWKNNWGHHSNYFVNDDKSVANLILMEDI